MAGKARRGRSAGGAGSQSKGPKAAPAHQPAKRDRPAAASDAERQVSEVQKSKEVFPEEPQTQPAKKQRAVAPSQADPHHDADGTGASKSQEEAPQPLVTPAELPPCPIQASRPTKENATAAGQDPSDIMAAAIDPMMAKIKDLVNSRPAAITEALQKEAREQQNLIHSRAKDDRAQIVMEFEDVSRTMEKIKARHERALGAIRGIGDTYAKKLEEGCHEARLQQLLGKFNSSVERIQKTMMGQRQQKQQQQERQGGDAQWDEKLDVHQ